MRVVSLAEGLPLPVARPPAAAGYLSRAYADSLAAFGDVIALPRSGGFLLRRPVADTAWFDATSCYPLFCCSDWAGIAADLDEWQDRLVSAVVVTDPFDDALLPAIRGAFGFTRHYKDHFVVETGADPATFVRRSHRDQARRALRRVDVEVCADPLAHLDEWVRLFDVLAHRHGIAGLRRFSRSAFERQLAVPGLVMFRAIAADRTVGLDLWYVQGDTAQGHLAAFDETGYALRASYATKWEVLRHFSDKVRFINLGAGRAADGSDGLSEFKRGFANRQRSSWLCGRIFDQPAYEALRARLQPAARGSDYFPIYRSVDRS